MNEIKLVQTCEACPEQYDAFVGERIVGYLRLRHGTFRVWYPDMGGEIIYEVETKGDGLFEPEERDYHLGKALELIRNQMS
jgi:hypothetical protein